MPSAHGLSPRAVADFCIALHRKNSEQLGLLPADRMLEYAERGQVLLALEGGEPCGYLICGLKAPWARVWQACVEFNLRGLGHGAELVEQLRTAALRAGCTGITLRCRDGLASNWFWRALGFTVICQVQGGGRRGRPLNVWAQSIAPDLLPPISGWAFNQHEGTHDVPESVVSA